MNIQTEPYHKLIERIPNKGKNIMGYQTEKSIIVYQAYKPSIAAFAVKHQYLGGDSFSYERMSWIKPGFLWMMYRCGWATKQDQERILALWLSKDDFKKILEQAVPSTFKPKQFENIEEWKLQLKQKDVRLQWDPDHDPYGNKQERKAIQLGMKGAMLEDFGKRFVQKIEDITEFVSLQKLNVDKHNLDLLQVPMETILKIENANIIKAIGL